jgi:hypothetical protein
MGRLLKQFFWGLCCFSFLYGQQLLNLKTADLNVLYYSTAHAYIVPHTTRSFTNTLNFYKHFWHYQMSEPLTLFLEDFSDWSNGGTTATPRNFIYLTLSPYFYVFEVAPANERMSLLAHHELVHLIMSDMATAKDRFYRTIIRGKPNYTKDNPISMVYGYLTAPRKYAPRWYQEGMAVFMETWMTGGIGRALSPYDEMVFRTKVRDNDYIYDMVGLESEGTAIDFQVGANSYLYGTRFFNYLAYQYGPEKLVSWTSRSHGSKRYFARQFKHVYGIRLHRAWGNWLKFEHKFQTQNLEAIRQNPTTAFRPITSRVLGSVSRSFFDRKSNTLITAVKYPGQVAHIARIDLATGRLKKIHDVKGASTYFTSSLAYDAEQGNLFFTTDNYEYRDLNVLDLQTGKSHRLIVDLRAGDLAFNRKDRSLWGVRHTNGISTIIKLNPPYTDWRAIYAFSYGTDIYDLDVSPDGRYLTGALTHISGQQELVRFRISDLERERGNYEQIFDFEVSSPGNFVYSDDGRYLFGSSYYSGVSNIYRYDFQRRDMNILSNCETGFFRPVPVNDDSLIVFRYNAKGFAPVWIANDTLIYVSAIDYLGQLVVEKYPVLKTWKPGSPAKINLDSITTYKGPYRSWQNTHLTSAYPVIEGYKNFASLGYRFEFANDMSYSRFNITLSYTPQAPVPKAEKLHFLIKYDFWRWNVTASYNQADFYDLFGPTKVSRKGYSLALSYKKLLIYDDPRKLEFSWRIAGYGGLEKLPDYQNVGIGTSFDRLFNGRTGLTYEYINNSLGNVDDEKGYRVQLQTSANYVNNTFYPRLNSSLDYGFALPWNHSSIWLRSSAGISTGDQDDPFANFYFGGFGNNWIDYQEPKRYRNYISFPGLEINHIGGCNFTKLLAEWTLPPLRFRHLGIPAFYVRWAHLTFFSSGIITNLDQPDYRTYFYNGGAQLDIHIVLFTLFKSTFSVGYARAYDESNQSSQEWMVSLKIL